MFTTTVRYLGTKPKPAMKALEPRFRPEQNQTITRAIFEILKEHGPLSVAQTWERVQLLLDAKCLLSKNVELLYDSSNKSQFDGYNIMTCILQQVGVQDLTSKTQMKTVLRWMKERQKLKQICNHVGPNKQFLYTTWFTPDVNKQRSTKVKSS
ncbi:hypothetical protein Tco_0631058 [Tanacetum coccineum]